MGRKNSKQSSNCCHCNSGSQYGYRNIGNSLHNTFFFIKRLSVFFIPKCNENFTNDVMNATDLPKQEEFYKHYLRGYDGKQGVIVIISDAFRYECAKELFSRLELDEKCTPKMECMLSCLPSVTSVGMASLLPHKEMQVDGNLNVTVDGQACASMEQRDKIICHVIM